MAKIFADVLTRAGGSLAAGNQLIRGFATNVANYNPVVNEADANQPQYLKTKGEATYINALSQALVAEGVTGHTFITDTSRNGKNSIRDWASWCNIKNAGLGPRPTTATGSPLIDAFVWIKPPGDSDGVSDPAAPRFDGMCASKVRRTSSFRNDVSFC
jgi:cellulose 1,4-beta-cellobiosidase